MNPPEPEQPGRKAFDLNYPDAELVIGLVFALGAEYEPALWFLMDQLRLSDYDPRQIKLSSTFQETADRLSIPLNIPKGSAYQEMDGRIRAGNILRKKTGRQDICALIASSMIASKRSQSEGDPLPNKRVAHIIISLKRPEEVDMLRRIYGPGFFLIGIFAGEAERKTFLTDRKGLSAKEALDLIARDQKEADGSGQRTRETFQMSDVFVSIEKSQYEPGLRRFLGLVFGQPFPTPTRDEHAMFLAYAASVRSGDLARQVGAALTCAEGEVVALGCNDVPAPWGGLYSVDDGPKKDKRDYSEDYGSDSNDLAKQQIIEDVIDRIKDYLDPENTDRAEEGVYKALTASDSRISQIAEFGRSVHAEMDALMAAGRNGISFRNATLYTTTFPCHTCTRHIITAGLKRVVYIEPYPKSRAEELHNDAIFIAGEENEDPGVRIPFAAFLGIGPRRFFDLFSLKLSSGYSIERKKDGVKVPWDLRTDSKPRVPMVPASYLEREQIASATLNSLRTETSQDAATRRKDATEDRARVLGVVGEDSPAGRKMA
jgi:deoxycytidylate deaminase